MCYSCRTLYWSHICPFHFQTTICDTQVFSCQRYQVESLFWTIYSRNCVIKWRWIMKHFMCQKTRKVSGVDVYVNIQLLIHIRFVHTNILSVKHNLDWNILMCPSQWLCNLRGGSVATPLLRLWVWILLGVWMFFVRCVLSSRGLCVGLITYPAVFN